MDDALARHTVDERDRLFERRLGGREILAVDGRTDTPQGVAQLRPELPIVLPILQTLTMRLERGCMRSHLNAYLQNP